MSFAYQEYLDSEFRVEPLNGVVEDKGVNKTIKNTYGNFLEVHEYWIMLDSGKVVVSKPVYDSVQIHKEVKILRTQHGMMIN